MDEGQKKDVSQLARHGRSVCPELAGAMWLEPAWSSLHLGDSHQLSLVLFQCIHLFYLVYYFSSVPAGGKHDFLLNSMTPLYNT